MPYSDYRTIDKAISSFNLTLRDSSNYFRWCEHRQPSQRLQDDLLEGQELAVGNNSEKSRSELIISPILMEVRRSFPGKISYFSGVSFNVDASRNLVGVCDFILSATNNQVMIKAPILTIVEAKNNDIALGLGQCVVEMIAAQVLNERDGIEFPICGVVSTGTNWQFMQLTGDELIFDRTEYYITQLDLILGILSEPFTKYFARDRQL